MKGYERQALLERLDRETATIGAAIPERLVVAGEPVPLRERVFALQQTGDREEIDELRIALRRVRQDRVAELETADIDRAAGEDLVETIIGIDRALEILDGLGASDDIEADMTAAEHADKERWMQFLRRALGHSDGQSPPRGDTG